MAMFVVAGDILGDAPPGAAAGLSRAGSRHADRVHDAALEFERLPLAHPKLALEGDVFLAVGMRRQIRRHLDRLLGPAVEAMDRPASFSLSRHRSCLRSMMCPVIVVPGAAQREAVRC